MSIRIRHIDFDALFLTRASNCRFINACGNASLFNKHIHNLKQGNVGVHWLSHNRDNIFI